MTYQPKQLDWQKNLIIQSHCGHACFLCMMQAVFSLIGSGLCKDLWDYSDVNIGITFTLLQHQKQSPYFIFSASCSVFSRMAWDSWDTGLSIRLSRITWKTKETKWACTIMATQAWIFSWPSTLKLTEAAPVILSLVQWVLDMFPWHAHAICTFVWLMAWDVLM